MFKKFIASILFCISAIAIATVSVSATPQTFTDVNPNDWHYEYIEQMTKDGYLAGYGNGKFGPNDNVTAAQMITMLERVYGDEKNIPSASEWNTYPWHKLDWVDGSYFFGRYNENISRETTAYLLFKASGLTLLCPENYETNYTEIVSDILFTANKYGYIIGFDDGKLHGNSLLTRAQACAILYRAIYENPNPEIPEMKSKSNINYKLLGYNNYEDRTIQVIEKELRYLPQKVINSFIKNNYNLVFANSNEYENFFKETCGTYMYSIGFYYKPQKVIGINDIKAKTIIHEFGHYLASEYGNKTDLNNLFNTEVSGVVKTIGRDYPKTSYQEFFADAFACYQLKNEQLKQNAPQTYEYIKNMISNL